MEKENVDSNVGASASKKRRLSLSLKKCSRFADISEETVESFACASIPKNSALNNKWAMRNLSEWLADHNERHLESPCPPEIVSSSCPKNVLSKWLPVFVLETRNQCGEKYPPKTLYNLLNVCSEPQLPQGLSFFSFSRVCCVANFAKARWKLWRFGMRCGYLTAVCLAKVITVRLGMYYKI